MLDKVSRVNPFVQMKGGPDPSPSQGLSKTLSKEEGNCKLLHVENNGK